MSGLQLFSYQLTSLVLLLLLVILSVDSKLIDMNVNRFVRHVICVLLLILVLPFVLLSYVVGALTDAVYGT